jgi:pimeloyl-ACP methyl ester carboxylesterase
MSRHHEYMAGTQIVDTGGGPVEVHYVTGKKPPVLVFPGGHATAETPIGEHIYSQLGFGVLRFSRPGYGGTEVGPITAGEFTKLVVETCRRLGVERSAAAVGVSFGGLQAIHTAVSATALAPKLILHSCAPSAWPYPDTWFQRVAAPLIFGSGIEKATWAAVRRLVARETGLKMMMKSLTRLTDDQWWAEMSPADRAAARAMFDAMQSGYGFLNDLRQADGRLSTYRAHIQTLVTAPTLVTASRHDGGVAFRHAENFAETIPHAYLYETSAPTHLYWIGKAQTDVINAVQTFLA